MQMLRKGLSFILFHKEAPAFAGWRHFVVVKKDAERGWGMIGRALKYLKHHELARCLNAWRSTFAEETRKEGSLRRALGHFVHRELSVGWSTWAAEAAEGVRLGELLYNCLRTIVLQRESLALRGWKHAHRQRVRKLNAMAHAFRHLRNQKLSAGWGTWVAKTARRGGAMHQLLSRSMHFLLNHELSRVWNQWVTTWAELERKRAALRRGFGHLKLRFRSRGWNAWAARTHETRETLRLVRRGLSFILFRRRALGFAGWKDFVQVEARRRHKTGQMTHALRHLMLRRLSGRGWMTWCGLHRQTKALRLSLGRAVGHFLHQRKSKGWNGWKERAAVRSHNRRLVRNALGFVRSTKLAHGLAGWKFTLDYFAQKREHARGMTLAIMHLMCRRSLAKGWLTWHAKWGEYDKARRGLRRGLGHFLHRQLSRGFVAWVEMAVDMRAYLEVASMQFSHVVVRPKPLDEDVGLARVPAIRRLWRCNERDKKDWALLHAAQQGHLATVQALVWRGALVGVCDGLNQNALHIAAFEGFLDVVKVLLDTEGCDIEARDACGHTALMLASLRGHLSVMRTLVEAGAQDDGSDPTMLMDEDRSAPVKMLI